MGLIADRYISFAPPHVLLLPAWNMDVMVGTLAAILVDGAILEDYGAKR